MKQEDVRLAFRHPAVMLASDGLLNNGQGHPRASGSFPRFLAEFARKGDLSLYDAINKMTAMPADRLGLCNKGRLNVGADADITIFDYEKVTDGATFAQPVLPPVGIDYVLIGGKIAARNCEIVDGTCGRAIRK
jgi:N-acyl-D-amino-acid deacylase